MPVTKKLSYVPEANSLAYIESPSDYVDSLSLAGNAAKVFTVPSGARFVRLSAGALFYYRVGAGAAIAPADVIGGGGSISVPSTVQPMFCVDNIATLGVIAPANCVVSAEWWA